MSDVTQILSQIEQGDPSAAERLLPLVYDELRRLASARLAQEKPGQTLQATALVHEAFVRLVAVDHQQRDCRYREEQQSTAKARGGRSAMHHRSPPPLCVPVTQGVCILNQLTYS